MLLDNNQVQYLHRLPSDFVTAVLPVDLLIVLRYLSILYE